MKKKKLDLSYPNQKINKVDYQEEMKKSYIDYAMSVIVSRALPDIRDGFKPVHRRILYAMNELNLSPDKGYRKSARIVGDTMGKYHPHGDSSIYEAMVRMAQYFSMRIPLIDGHGNFGNIDGDSPAAMRYTEARLQKIAYALLSDLDKGVVDFSPNFDETLKEPCLLPAKFPNLLINGSSGIAVGMATNIPTHNTEEVINAAIAYLKNEDISTKELLKYIKGPDFPTGGIICNKKDLLNFYENGKGKFIIRSTIETELLPGGKSKLLIKDIPYTYSNKKEKLVAKIKELIQLKKLDEANFVQDESSKEGLLITIELKKGVDPEKVKEKLYAITPLQDNFTMNCLALIDGKPVVFNLKLYFQEFTKFQREIYTKKFLFEKKSLVKKVEVLNGLIQAYQNIDVIIEALRGTKKLQVVKKCLMQGDVTGITFKTKKSEKVAKTFCYTEIQANSILEMKLQQLINIEEELLKKDLENVSKELERIENILSNRDLLDKEIIDYLKAFAKENPCKRLTKIQNIEIKPYKEVITVEPIVIAIDKLGYLKSYDFSFFEKNKEAIDESNKFTCESTNLSSVFVFTEKGFMHKIKTKDILKCRLNDKGTQIASLVKYENDYTIKIFPEIVPEEDYLFITKKGLIKRVSGSELLSNRKTISASKLEEDDVLVDIEKISLFENNKINLKTTDNREINLSLDDIPNLKKTALGVSALKLKEFEYVESLNICKTNKAQKRGSTPKK